MSETIKKLSVLCKDAAKALGITQGEFWIWYGSPLLLPGSCSKK